MKLDEAQLYRAAKLADAMELAMLPDEETCPKHEFSEKFERDMEALLRQVERGEIKPYRVSMGWQYYTKRGVAAVLLCFLLACITMPEAVIAGYHKLLEVIEYVMEDRTDYRYSSNVPADTEFVPIEFGYMSEGMELVYRRIDEKGFRVIYESEDKYFNLKQWLVTEDTSLILSVDSQDTDIETKVLHGTALCLLKKGDKIHFMWQYEQYHISGRCNLTIEELEKILENIEI